MASSFSGNHEKASQPTWKTHKAQGKGDIFLLHKMMHLGRQGTVARVSIYSWQEKYQDLQILLCMQGPASALAATFVLLRKLTGESHVAQYHGFLMNWTWKVVSEGKQNTKLIEYCCSAFLLQCSLKKYGWKYQLSDDEYFKENSIMHPRFTQLSNENNGDSYL